MPIRTTIHRTSNQQLSCSLSIDNCLEKICWWIAFKHWDTWESDFLTLWIELHLLIQVTSLLFYSTEHLCFGVACVQYVQHQKGGSNHMNCLWPRILMMYVFGRLAKRSSRNLIRHSGLFPFYIFLLWSSPELCYVQSKISEHSSQTKAWDREIVPYQLPVICCDSVYAVFSTCVALTFEHIFLPAIL
jgi:hypothetical protein